MSSKGGGLRPSPAMAVAFVALFVALAGTVIAAGSKVPGTNGVKSSDIAPKNVKGSDIRDEAVTGSKVAPDALTGSDIDYGIHKVTATSADNTAGATATCPADEIAIGGGSDSFDPVDTGAVTTNTPTPAVGDTPTGWQALYESTANAGDIAVYVICIPT